MGKRDVTVEFIKDQLNIPRWGLPHPDPLPDVSRIVYNGFTTQKADCKRVFVPLIEASLNEHRNGDSDSWPYHLRCSKCGHVFGYFDCYTTTGENRVLTMRYCKNCGAKIMA